MPSNHFLSVALRPLPGDQCMVTFRCNSLIGFPLQEGRVLSWSAGEPDRVAANEHHDAQVRYFMSDESPVASVKWNLMRGFHLDADDVAKQIKDWNQDGYGSLAAIDGVELRFLHEDLAHYLQQGPLLVFRFSDGEKRVVPINLK